MAGGLAALLDDVAMLVKLTAASIDDVGAAAGKASTKAVGVIVDDAAVTPRYVQGISPKRELTIIGKIARGSIRNKLVFILPAIMLLSQFAPWALTPLLMIGGTYLCFEGAEKIWEKITGHHSEVQTPAAQAGPDQEKTLVGGAVRTDFILSAEIMVIALSEVADESFWMRLGALVVVAFFITALVYGVVAVIVKMDDVGLAMVRRRSKLARRTGRYLVRAMPVLMAVLSYVGVIAMLWVGGHIVLNGIHELGWDPLYDFVHHLQEKAAHAAPFFGGFVGWLVNTFFSAILGFVVGSVVAGIVHVVKPHKPAPSEQPAPGEAQT
ncbi:hypothetical protein GOARA_050_00210 [Gordonia araii NBRC 100433]|uniref:Inner membrane protein YedI n=1 Tax=Gordonia araii NBRC 100433 TaxID=1073574 RepID=G7H284_9ACTN|nr:DUF808 domain-containing protein [Gordonia araii]NNG97498.1 DUF808 domain-containing protein [Gordonia araii NBRC 100433]GAB09959.1 hypothetical protein GOARA_050_00210 [Gordonia araii NBRC 100433]